MTNRLLYETKAPRYTFDLRAVSCGLRLGHVFEFILDHTCSAAKIRSEPHVGRRDVHLDKCLDRGLIIGQFTRALRTKDCAKILRRLLGAHALRRTPAGGNQNQDGGKHNALHGIPLFASRATFAQALSLFNPALPNTALRLNQFADRQVAS